MGSTTDKIKGTASEAIGKPRATSALRRRRKGKGQKAVGGAKEMTKEAIDRAAAAANKNL